MACDHSNKISSCQIQTLVIFKIAICNKIKYRDQFKIVIGHKIKYRDQFRIDFKKPLCIS